MIDFCMMTLYLQIKLLLFSQSVWCSFLFPVMLHLMGPLIQYFKKRVRVAVLALLIIL